MRRFFRLAVSAALPLVMALPQAARGQALDVDSPDIEKGERELRFVNGINSGWRNGSAGEPRSTHKAIFSYSPTGWLRLVSHIEATDAIVDGWRADHVAIESFIALRKAEESGIALSWYTSAQTALDDLGVSSVIFGPVVRFGFGKTQLTGNQLFEETFAHSRAPGINAIYGWQVKHALSERVALGVEMFGAIENMSDAPPWREQDHRLGPSIYFTWDLGSDRKLGLDVGVFAGLTDAAPDATIKINSGTTF